MPQPVARDAALPRFHVRELTRTVSSPTPSRLRPSPSVKSTSSQRITPAEQLSQISSESHSPSQLLQRSSESQSASRLHQRSHGRSGVYELQMPHQRADAPPPQVSVSVRPRFSDDPTPAKPPLFVQDLPVGDSALPSEMAEKLSLSRLSSAREAPFISPLRDADAVRACHDIVYSKITALEEAMAARDGRPESDLHEIAESYISKNKGPTKIRGGIETLRTACRGVAHPIVLLFGRLMQWSEAEVPSSNLGAPSSSHAAEAAAEGRQAIWLLLELLLPPHNTLYPLTPENPPPKLAPAWQLEMRSAAAGKPPTPGVPPGWNDSAAALAPAAALAEARGDRRRERPLPHEEPKRDLQIGKAHVGWTVAAKADEKPDPTSVAALSQNHHQLPEKPAREEKGRGRSDAAKPAETKMPPRMLLSADSIPKLLGVLSRRQMIEPVDLATPYLTDAAYALMELDRDENGMVDIEEVLLYWLELWGRWDMRTWEWNLATLPPDKLPPRERVRKLKAHGQEDAPLRIQLRTRFVLQDPAPRKGRPAKPTAPAMRLK